MSLQITGAALPKGAVRPTEAGRTAMVLNLVVIGVVVALDPLPLTAFLVVLRSRRGVRKCAAFVFGWLVSLAVVVTLPSRKRYPHSRRWPGRSHSASSLS
jgi:Sap, sulfolipid-1-addressing protein